MKIRVWIAAVDGGDGDYYHTVHPSKEKLLKANYVDPGDDPEDYGVYISNQVISLEDYEIVG